MKTHRFKLANWLATESDGTGNIYIDWPSVHRQAGLDHIQWLKSQDPLDCQLVVETKKDDSNHYLVAEIYSDKIATLYGLMWAK
jgi:hypothetical protein